MTITTTSPTQELTLPLLTTTGIAQQILDKREMFGTARTFTEGIEVHDPSHPKANHHGYRALTRGEYVKALRLLRREDERQAQRQRLAKMDDLALALADPKRVVVSVPSMNEAPDPKLVEASRVARELAKDQAELTRRRQSAIERINQIARAR